MLNERLLTIDWQQHDAAGSRPRRRRGLAVDQHLRRRRPAGNRVDRCAEAARRRMHDDVLAAARRPRRRRPERAARPARRRRVRRRRRRHRPEERQPRRGVRRCAAASTSAHLVRIARELPRDRRRAAAAVRRDQGRPDGAGRRPGQPGAGRPARPAAGDRRRVPAPAGHPDRRRRADRRRAGGAANCCPAPTRTRPPGAAASGTPRACRPARCVPTSAEPPSSTTHPTACACRSAPPATCRPWSSSRSTGSAPGPGQIEVAVTASSLNFADVLVAFGRYPSFEGQLPQLGTDFAGVVTAVGPDVTEHRVGDRVGGMSPNGCWGTFVTCDARLAVTAARRAVRRPGRRGDHRTRHRLVRPARPGQDHGRDKVLIHSATGGVGQAAIAIARAAGAEIFATAGSPRASRTVARHGYRARLRFAQPRVRRGDPTRHRRLRRRHRAQLADRCRAARRSGTAGLRRTVRRDRQARHLRRHPAGAVPVPAQPDVLRRRPGVDDAHPPRPGPRAAEHGLPADRRRCAAAAAEHALPARRGGHRDSA